MNRVISEADLIINKDGSVYHLGIRPEQLGDVIFVVGDPDRVPYVSQYFDKVTLRSSRREFVCHTGMLNGVSVTVLSTGMGTDNVEIVLTELDALLNIDFTTRQAKEVIQSKCIIRLGTSGALQPEVELGSVVLSEQAVGLDTLMAFYDLPMDVEQTNLMDHLGDYLGLGFTPYLAKGNAELLDVFPLFPRVTTVTCPGFYGPQGRATRVPAKFANFSTKLQQFKSGKFVLHNFEMETAGYYSLGAILGHKLLSINAIVAHRFYNRFAADMEGVVKTMIEQAMGSVSTIAKL